MINNKAYRATIEHERSHVCMYSYLGVRFPLRYCSTLTSFPPPKPSEAVICFCFVLAACDMCNKNTPVIARGSKRGGGSSCSMGLLSDAFSSYRETTPKRVMVMV